MKSPLTLRLRRLRPGKQDNRTPANPKLVLLGEIASSALKPTMNDKHKLQALLIMGSKYIDRIYGGDELHEITNLVKLLAPPIDTAKLDMYSDILRETEVIFSGWGAPRLNAKFLLAAPKLRAFFYASGSIKHIVTDAFWKAHIPLCSAWKANAIPVAEYAFSQILFSLKCGWQYVAATRQRLWSAEKFVSAGAFESTVGIVSLGEIGRLLIRQ